MGLFSFFNSGSLKSALRKGAIIIDVRTAQEFDTGKVPGSINIPVDRIAINAPRIMGFNVPIIFCCTSGTRSQTAKNIMIEKGMKEVYSGGSWERMLKLQQAI